MSIVSQTQRPMFNGTGNIAATTNYVYNDSLSQLATSGWMDGRYDNLYLQANVATLVAGNCKIRIEGKYDSGLDRIASLHVQSFSSVHTIGEFITITPPVEKVRVGVAIDAVPGSPLASPCNVYLGLSMIEKK